MSFSTAEGKLPRYTPIGILRLRAGTIWVMAQWGIESLTIVLRQRRADTHVRRHQRLLNQERRMRLGSLMWAVLIVVVSMAGATWLQESRRFPWHVLIAPIFPALATVIAAAGGPHEASGNRIISPATFTLATLMRYGLIELVRLIRSRSTHGTGGQG